MATPRHAEVAPGECFQCGLPAGVDTPFRFEAAGAMRKFCCAGCEAVARVINGQDLDDYYRLRATQPSRPGSAARPVVLEAGVVDSVEVQQRFVRDSGVGHVEAELVIEGMRCAACAWLVERMLARVPGVTAAEVNATTRRAWVRWKRAEVAPSRLLQAVREVGYTAWPHEEGRIAALDARERRGLLRRLWVAGFGMMQVMMYAFPAYVAAEGEVAADGASLMRWAGLLLTAPVLAYSAAPFFRGAWRDLRNARLGMDVSVALGLAAAFAASTWATLLGTGEVYFDSVTMFVFLLTGGRFLEHEARVRAARSLDHLAGFMPQSAARLVDVERLETETIARAWLKVHA